MCHDTMLESPRPVGGMEARPYTSGYHNRYTPAWRGWRGVLREHDECKAALGD